MKKLKKCQIIFIMIFIFLWAGISFASETSVLLENNATSVKVSGTNYVFTTGDALCTAEINGTFTLDYSKENKGYVTCGSVKYALPLTITSQNPITINGLNYKGRISLIENGGILSVVNYLDREDYLAGVLACEMSPKWPLEALKAQAILARTYLVQNAGRRHGSQYAICNTEHCQTYKGIPNDSGNITKALEETKDLVVYYNDQPAQVFYFTDSGGITASSKDVWSGQEIPYLVPRPDPEAIAGKAMTWEFKCAMSTLQEKLKSSNIDVGTISSVTITQRDGSGRVKELEIKGENGTQKIPVSTFCSLFGSKDIKSRLFKFAKADEPSTAKQAQTAAQVKKTTTVQKMTTKPNKKFNSKIDELIWLADQGAYTTTELCAALADSGHYDKYIKNGYEILRTGKKTAKNTPDTTVTELVTVETSQDKAVNNQITNDAATDSAFLIIGYGYGHGVGMPQNQCKYLAQAGWTYDQILAYYFPDTMLKREEKK